MISDRTKAYYDLKKRNDVRESAKRLRRQFLRYKDAEIVYSIDVYKRQEYDRLLASRGREVKVMEKERELVGTCLGIDEAGELLVQTPGGACETIFAGEVSVRGLYGYV